MRALLLEATEKYVSIKMLPSLRANTLNSLRQSPSISLQAMGSASKISVLCLFFFFFLLCLLRCSAMPRDFSILGYSEDDLTSHDSLIDIFESWMDKHGRIYDSLKEKLRRFEIFKDNLKHIDEVNKMGRSYWLGLNDFADLTHEEFKDSFFGLKPDFTGWRSEQKGFMYENAGSLPKSVDWRKKGAVTYVKNQGQCGKKLNHFYMLGNSIFT